MYPLPPYARKVEYLESTGTQWIDTGVYADDTTKMTVRGTFFNEYSDGNVSTRLGSRSAIATSGFDALYISTGYFRIDLGTGTSTTAQWSTGINKVLTEITLDASAKFASLKAIDGTTASHTYTSNMTFVDAPSLTLFFFTTGTDRLPGFHMRISSCQLWQNGSLVRSFIPCRINGIGYLWDEVNGNLYENKGTGEFVLGQDIREGAIPSKINPMGVGRRIDPAPYDAELEYLETTGTQWISTPLKISSQGRLQVDASFNNWTGASAECVWCGRAFSGSSQTINSIALFKNANGTLGWDVRPTGSTARISVTYAGDSNRHSFKQEAGVLYIDGTQVATTTATVTESGGALYLFASNYTDGTMTSPASGRLYSAEYWDANGNLVMKLVPVKKNGVGYMFDMVSGQFFGNAGTGSFGLGPVKGYIQDGLIMQLDGFYNEDTQRHNGSVTVWKDLAGDRNVTLTRASNGWNKDSLNTKVVTGGATGTIMAGKFPGIHYAPNTTVEMVYKVDTAQNANGEVLTFVGGYERMAISHVSGGTAGELFIASAPDTRIGVDMTSPDIDQDLTTRGIIQQIAIVFGQSNDTTGWAIYHKSNPQPIYNRGGSLGTQTDGTGTIMGRISSSPDNCAGVVYALRIYNRALTQEEVKHNWELDKARFNIV